MSSSAFAAGTKSPAVAVAEAKPGEGAGNPSEMSEEDLRVAVLTVMGKPGTGEGVKRVGSKALDGTADDVRRFLEVGHEARKIDNGKKDTGGKR